MKVAVATNDFETVAGHVGRCRGFILYEISGNGEIIGRKEIPNTFTNHSQHNHAHEHGHNANTQHGADAHNNIAQGIEFADYLICRAAGPGLVNALASFGIRTVFTQINAADEAVKLLISNSLKQDESECDK